MYYDTSAKLEKLELHSTIASCDFYPSHELSNLQRAPQLDGRTLTLNQLSEQWSSQLWMQFKQLRMIEACKSQDFNGVWTRDLAIPVGRSHQLSYEATDVVSWSFVVSNEPWGCMQSDIRYVSYIQLRMWNQVNYDPRSYVGSL